VIPNKSVLWNEGEIRHLTRCGRSCFRSRHFSDRNCAPHPDDDPTLSLTRHCESSRSGRLRFGTTSQSQPLALFPPFTLATHPPYCARQIFNLPVRYETPPPSLNASFFPSCHSSLYVIPFSLLIIPAPLLSFLPFCYSIFLFVIPAYAGIHA